MRARLLVAAIIAVSGVLPAVAAPTRPYDQGGQFVNVRAFGANGTDTLDDTAAIVAADAAAQAVPGARVWFPGGTYVLSAPTVANVTWEGAGKGATIIRCPAPCGVGAGVAAGGLYQGAPAITLSSAVTNFPRIAILKSLTLSGPGPAPGTDPRQLGIPTAGLDGVGLAGTFSEIDDVEITGFDAGVTIVSISGHYVIRNSKITGNYYGVYSVNDYFDGFIVDSDLRNNARAGYAHAALVATLTMERVQLGSQPYGVYADALGQRNPVSGLLHSLFDDVSFERIGNAAIFTENATLPIDIAGDTRTIQTWQGGLDIRRPRFSWDPASRILSKPRDYALVFGAFSFPLRIDDSQELPFVNGDVGTLLLGKNDDQFDKANSIYWHRPAGPAPVITVASGTTDNIAIRPHEIDKQGDGATIAALATSAVVTTSYLGPADSIYPSAQARGTGGLTGSVELVVGPVTSSPATGTSFTVSVVGGIPTAPVPFTWKVVQ